MQNKAVLDKCELRPSILLTKVVLSFSQDSKVCVT